LARRDQPSIEKALAELWGQGWSHAACAREAGVDRGTVRHLVCGENIWDKTWAKIVKAFRKRRSR
jgi:hypothetical protein